jgi:hypothetical protein
MQLHRTVIVVVSIFYFLAVNFPCFSQEEMRISIAGNHFMPDDTLKLECVVPDWVNDNRSGVLHVWMEDTQKRNAWKLRFPVIQGKVSPQLIIDASLPAGQYALYCQLHTQPFYVNAKLKEKYRQDSIMVTMQLKNDELLTSAVAVKDQQKFWLGKIIFEEQATLFFSPYKNAKINYIDAVITTPLDSTFTPIAETTLFAKIGNAATEIAAEESYKVNFEYFTGKEMGTLKNVEVIGKMKTEIEKFNEASTTGYFKSDNAYVFGGLENQFSANISIFEYLRGRVPGLQFTRGNFPGAYTVSWRGATPDFFLNEMGVTAETLALVSPSDVAMIKVFRPPFMGAFLGGPGGAIAVYTRSGGAAYGNKPFYSNKFVVNGYTPIVYRLKGISTQ